MLNILREELHWFNRIEELADSLLPVAHVVEENRNK